MISIKSFIVSVILAFMIGGMIGIFVMNLMAAAKKEDDK